jgi:hypothetical protein
MVWRGLGTVLLVLLRCFWLGRRGRAARVLDDDGGGFIRVERKSRCWMGVPPVSYEYFFGCFLLFPMGKER